MPLRELYVLIQHRLPTDLRGDCGAKKNRPLEKRFAVSKALAKTFRYSIPQTVLSDLGKLPIFQ